MRYDPNKHHRRSIRLKGYDYTQAGVYFVTIVTQNRACLFGHIVAGEVRLNAFGQVVAETWLWLATQYDYVELDEWVVMPNHLHGIVVITDTDNGRPADGGGVGGGSRTAPTVIGATGGGGGVGGGSRTVPTVIGATGGGGGVGGGSRTAPTVIASTAPMVKRKPLGRLIGAFKTVSTKRINEYRGTPGVVVWQRNYYEHIIRDERSLNRIREYIAANPLRWHLDRENVHAAGTDPGDAEWFGG
jgi:putative transposase